MAVLLIQIQNKYLRTGQIFVRRLLRICVRRKRSGSQK